VERKDAITARTHEKSNKIGNAAMVQRDPKEGEPPED